MYFIYVDYKTIVANNPNRFSSCSDNTNNMQIGNIVIINHEHVDYKTVVEINPSRFPPCNRNTNKTQITNIVIRIHGITQYY